MPHKWINVKNSTKGGNRPVEDFQLEIESGIAEFEHDTGLTIDSVAREAFGARGFSGTHLRERTYSHPFPHIVSCGGYVFCSLSVPADLEDGRPNFTNFSLVATDKFVLSTLADPHSVYNPYFGGAIVSKHGRHLINGSDSVSETVLSFLSFSVAAIDHSLDAMSNRLLRNRYEFEKIDQRDGRHVELEVKKRQPIISNLNVEINSLTTVIRQLEEITRAVMNNEIVLSDGSEFRSFFDESQRRNSTALFLQAARLRAYHANLTFDCASFLQTLSGSRDSALAFATHRITAFGAAILIPNMLFDFFGQGSFDGMPAWFSRNGLLLTAGITALYWALQFWWFKRKRFI